MTDNMRDIVDAAGGRSKSDLVLKNARIVNVFTQEIVEGDIAIFGNMIAGIGRYEGMEEIDLEGRFAIPGLIDGHMHLESAMVLPAEFSRVVTARGTTTVIADPHEIANVCGEDGIRFMLEQSRNAVLDVFIMLPSCVPATPFDSSGARLCAADLVKLADGDRILGLGEMMDFMGVTSGRQDTLDKIKIFSHGIVDGHAPGLSGNELNSYAAAGVRTEHECGSIDEMHEKLRLGFYILIREGSAAKDLGLLVKGVNNDNRRRCLFCTDDRHLEDILESGHIDNNVRLAVSCGIDPVKAVTMATLNAAECYALRDRGAISPGYRADIVILDDLYRFKISQVYKNGRQVVQSGYTPFSIKGTSYKISDTVRLAPLTGDMLRIEMRSSMANVIGITPGSLVTKKIIRQVSTEGGAFKYNSGTDPIKLAVMERHRATGRVGLGLLDGLGLRGGAVASTVSHDSHNLIAAGDADTDILLAANELHARGGGITICSGGRVLKTLPLPVAGLMSVNSYEETAHDLKEMLEIVHGMGVPDEVEPFMILSFLALTVIPEIRLTDSGLFDVGQNRFISVCAG